MKRILIFILIPFSLLFSSCNKENRWDCIKRTGEKTTDTRILPPFTKVYLKDNIDVFITQGATQEVKIAAGKNLISLIKTEVINGELHLSNDNKCNWARSYKNGVISVYITMPTLSFITNDGSGNIKSQGTISCDTMDVWTKESGDVELTLNANVVFVQIYGSSDVTVHGKTNVLGIDHADEGFLYCQDLQTDMAWSTTKSAGNEYFNVKNSLSVTIDWVGNIYYLGNPLVYSKGTGSGKIIHQN
ncbi:MAG: head GIN domain-containing protein [Bacteroidia bacterium]